MLKDPKLVTVFWNTSKKYQIAHFLNSYFYKTKLIKIRKFALEFCFRNSWQCHQAWLQYQKQCGIYSLFFIDYNGEVKGITCYEFYNMPLWSKVQFVIDAVIQESRPCLNRLAFCMIKGCKMNMCFISDWAQPNKQVIMYRHELKICDVMITDLWC